MRRLTSTTVLLYGTMGQAAGSCAGVDWAVLGCMGRLGAIVKSVQTIVR